MLTSVVSFLGEEGGFKFRLVYGWAGLVGPGPVGNGTWWAVGSGRRAVVSRRRWAVGSGRRWAVRTDGRWWWAVARYMRRWAVRWWWRSSYRNSWDRPTNWLQVYGLSIDQVMRLDVRPLLLDFFFTSTLQNTMVN